MSTNIVGRPALVWVTLVLVGLCVAMFFVSAVGVLLSLPSALAISTPASRLAFALAWPAGMLLATVTLFYGVVRRRRWAWTVSVIFATWVLVLVFWGRAAPVNGALPRFEIKPEEMLGAAVAEVMITVLVVMYPMRMYFSDKVRRYFGIAPSKARRVFGSNSAFKPTAGDAPGSTEPPGPAAA